jgi:hypothetical protein
LQRFLDGEFRCFGHGKPHIEPEAFGSFNLARALSTVERTRLPEAVSADREACLQCVRSGADDR